MKRISLLLISIAFTLLSCNTKDQGERERALIKQYYAALNNFELEAIAGYFYDSVRMRENDYLYLASKDSFYIKLQWDSVFRPKYGVLEIEAIDKDLIVKVSKSDPRILFLNEEPTIYRERFTFKQGKIYSSEILEYTVFNWDLWDENRSKIVDWIKENHPDLDGFLYDQTKQGALNYIEAIKLFIAAYED